VTVLLIILALVVGFFGAMSLTQATLGVGIICSACLIGILGRIAQAYEQHRELRKLLSSVSTGSVGNTAV
jgi:hypothetical protein